MEAEFLAFLLNLVQQERHPRDAVGIRLAFFPEADMDAVSVWRSGYPNPRLQRLDARLITNAEERPEPIDRFLPGHEVRVAADEQLVSRALALPL